LGNTADYDGAGLGSNREPRRACHGSSLPGVAPTVVVITSGGSNTRPIGYVLAAYLINEH